MRIRETGLVGFGVDVRFSMKVAIESEDVDQVRTLLTAKADPNEDFTSFYPYARQSPLELAASLHSPVIVRLLLDAKGDITKKPRLGADAFGANVLWQVRNTEIFQILLEAKADPLQKADDSSTLMHRMAYRNGHTEIMQILLGLNVSISDRDENGKTPLHYAAEAGNNEGILRFLLKHKANIFEETNDRRNVIFLRKQCMLLATLTTGHDLGTVELLKTEMKRQCSVATLAGLHRRAGARSPLAHVARRSTIFDQQALRLVLKLAGCKTPDSLKRKREDDVEEAAVAVAINSSLGSRK